MPNPTPIDLHEWVSFDDADEDRTWVWDVTFLTSNWTCIYGRGCPGILDGPAPEWELGCCSYGAHFTDEADRAKVEAKAALLGDDEWQFKAKAEKKGAIHVNDDGETVSRLADDACIFLNRPDFPGGAGCALHAAAVRRGESFLDWKPEVCWQAPMRRIDETDAYGHVTSTVREWKRRDWGPGGQEFHWWCTDSPDAFVGDDAVYLTCADELVAMTSPAAYAVVRDYLQARAEAAAHPVDHPALEIRRRRPKKDRASLRGERTGTGREEVR